MSQLRRLVIALAETVAVLGIIVFTLVGGISGAGYARLVGFGFGGQQDYTALGFLIGAMVGFFVSALPAAFLFTMSEILANTRRMIALLQHGTTRIATADSLFSPGPLKAEPSFFEGTGPRFRQVHKELSQASHNVLKRAREEGYELHTAPDATEVSVKKGSAFIRFTSNEQIEGWGRKQGWL